MPRSRMFALASPDLDEICEGLRRKLGADLSLLTILGHEHQFFRGVAGTHHPWIGLRYTPLSHSICAIVAETGRPLDVSDAWRDARLLGHPALSEFGIGAYLGAPVVETGIVIGVLSVIQAVPRAWTVDELRAVSAVADDLAADVDATAIC